MCKFILQASAVDGVAINDGLTRYFAVKGFLVNNATEATVESSVRDAGTISNLWIYVSASAHTEGGTVVATVRKSRADTAITVSWNANNTGAFVDDTHTDATFAATDEIAVKVVTPAHTGTVAITFNQCAVTFESSTAGRSTSLLGGRTTGNVIVNSDSVYNLPTGKLSNGGSATLPEAEITVPLRAAFTGGGLFCNVGANARTTTSYLKSRKNSGDGACVITISAAETGQMEDDTPGTTDSFASGDTFNLAYTAGAGSSEILTFLTMEYMLTNTDGHVQYMAAVNSTGVLSANQYYPISGGNYPQVNATEALVAILPQFDFTAKELQCYVDDAGSGADAVFLRDNLGSSALTVGIASTGSKRDSSNTVTITGGTDEIDLLVTRSVDLRVTWISFLGYVATGATPLTATGTSDLGSYAGSSVAGFFTYARPLTDDLNA